MTRTEHAAPQWLERIVTLPPADDRAVNPVLHRQAPGNAKVRDASVLVLFGGSEESDPVSLGGLPENADVLLTQRAATLRQHSGQVAFPGGAADPGDDGPIATALREAEEETGLDPSGVRALAVLPGIFVPPSGFDVTPVIGYWERPTPIRPVDHGETARGFRSGRSSTRTTVSSSNTGSDTAGPRSRSTVCSSGDSPQACWPA